MGYRVFISRRIPQIGVDLLRRHGCAVTMSEVDRPLTIEEIIAAAQECVGLVSMLTDAIGEKFLAACPKIRAVSQFAVGTNNIDLAACKSRGVLVGNTPGVLTDATAETAFALLMACARRVAEGDAYLRRHATLRGAAPRESDWSGWAPLQFLGQGIVGKTLGIVGAGRIGCRMAKMAAGFDMKLLYTARRASPEMEQLCGQRAELEALLRTSDFVSLHVPATPETRHMINAPRLALMKPTAILINTARGSVIDEEQLAHALRTGVIAGAGLDVFEAEPAVSGGLIDLPNAVLLPHIGSATFETRDRMAAIVAENMIGMLDGTGARFAVATP